MTTEKLLHKVHEVSKSMYENIITLVFSIILFFTTLSILIGAVRLFFRIDDVFQAEGVTGNYVYIFSDVLTLFILIELSRSLYEYITIRKLRLVLILDAAIVFILREIMIALFKHELSNESTYSLSALLLVLGLLRISCTYCSETSKNSTLTHENEKDD